MASTSPPTPPVPPSPPEVKNKKTLTYSIHKVSSTSNTSVNYSADNILNDLPNDPSSRWSSDSNSPPQFLVLRLEKVSVVTSITFGKFEKNHVCNLKRFKIYGGFDEDNMVELLDSGLKNDTTKETFRLRHTVHGRFFPCKFVKIVPIQSWGPSFNFSIWFVAVNGDDSEETVSPAMQWHNEYREKEAIRLCLKHFRQHNYTDVFACLQKKTRVQLEHPLLSELYDQAVRSGDYLATEQLVFEASQDGLFDRWIETQKPVPKWYPMIVPVTDEGSASSDFLLGEGAVTADDSSANATQNNSNFVTTANSSPVSQPASPLDDGFERVLELAEAAVLASRGRSMVEGTGGDGQAAPLPQEPGPSLPRSRGGHQMVIDSSSQTIYLFGGWDGKQDLGDFWSYHIPSDKWALISSNTENEGGPSPRSCHKMVLDSSCRHIFVLGRYLERINRDSSINTKSDFFMFDITTNRWTLITDDTAALGGPNLIFDHQMCIDQNSRTIYVFGGQTLVSAAEEMRLGNDKRYSGLFEYQIPTNTWKKRKEESLSSASSSSSVAVSSVSNNDLRSRSSHSMLFHHGLRKLYIFGGQRKRAGQRDEYLNDFFSYCVDTDEVEIISTGSAVMDCTIPAVGHTQRATIDCERNEIHVMTGLNKDKEKEKEKVDSKRDSSKVSNSFWVYNIVQDRWSCFYKNDNSSADYWSTVQYSEPRPRYAHQLVFDEVNRVHFMFGGNPGGKQGKEDRVRLGDFWRLDLLRPSREEVVRKCRTFIRQARFSELAMKDKLAALTFLQTSLSEIINHDDEDEERQFRLSATKIFQPSSAQSSTESPSNLTIDSKTDLVHNLRSELFETLSAYFPAEMTHPRGNLLDLVTYPMETGSFLT